MKYQAFYCEENIWQLAKQRQEADGEVWFIINAEQMVATAMQKSVEQAPIVLWDYHVVYYSPSEGVFDFDSLCDFPCDAAQYLKLSFEDYIPFLNEEYIPSFRVFSSKAYLEQFSSNRQHMQDEQGNYLHTPPPWDCLGKGNTLSAFIDFDDKCYGEIVSLEQLCARLA